MTESVIVDTNLLCVANGQTPQASDACREATIDALERVRQHDIIVLDAAWNILNEYLNNVRLDAQGVGTLFLKWVLTNVQNPTRCRQVPIEEHPDRGFVAFPDDPALASFDPSDRKFVAVAIVHHSEYGTVPPVM